MICPYYEQGRVIKAKIKKNGRIINICEECDTVWKGEIDLLTGISFDEFMKNKGMKETGMNTLWQNLPSGI